jgi:16S rRNA C967 or C1407 C5-methylase (RsmB/RsmF family)
VRVSHPEGGADAREIGDAVAAAWERHREQLFEDQRAVSEWIVDQVEPRPGQTILELAAGPGETGFLAAERVGPDGRLISTDVSPRMIEAARRGAEPAACRTSSSGSWTRNSSTCRTRASTVCCPGLADADTRAGTRPA